MGSELLHPNRVTDRADTACPGPRAEQGAPGLPRDPRLSLLRAPQECVFHHFLLSFDQANSETSGSRGQWAEGRRSDV